MLVRFRVYRGAPNLLVFSLNDVLADLQTQPPFSLTFLHRRNDAHEVSAGLQYSWGVCHREPIVPQDRKRRKCAVCHRPDVHNRVGLLDINLIRFLSFSIRYSMVNTLRIAAPKHNKNVPTRGTKTRKRRPRYLAGSAKKKTHKRPRMRYYSISW